MGCILTEWVKNSLLGILLVRFVHILLFRHFLCSFVHRMQKIEKLSKIVVNFLDDFLPILYHKVKNYCFLPKRHPLATANRCVRHENLFLTLFYDPDHCVRQGNWNFSSEITLSDMQSICFTPIHQKLH